MHPPGSAIVSSSTRLFSALTLLWLTGNALRLTVLAVPPVIPLIHDDLQLTATQVGILTGLPSMLLAAAAVPGSLLIAKLGVRSALVVGLVVNAMAGAVRGAFPNVLWLYAMTIATAAGVAVMQVTMPSAVRAWLPDRIGFATAVYTNGLLIGEVLPVMLTLPLVLPLVGNWQWGFVVWSAPVLLIAILVQIFPPTRASGASPVRVRWWPDWGNKLIWRLGFMLGTVNALYFRQRVHPEFSARPRPERMDQRRADRAERWTAARLFRVARLCASVGIESLAYRRLRRDRHGGDADGSGPVIVAGTTLVGLCCASILVLVLALPPLLAKPDDVHRVTAAMFTISYSCGVIAGRGLNSTDRSQYPSLYRDHSRRR
jgi:CP family cyanate transporter-like MFS transporter